MLKRDQTEGRAPAGSRTAFNAEISPLECEAILADAARKDRRVVLRFFGAWVLLAVCIALGLGSLNWFRFWALYRSGVQTEGYVAEPEPGNDGSFCVKYSVDGATHTVEGYGYAVRTKPADGPLKKGDRVLVYYIPRRPSVSCFGMPDDLLHHETLSILLPAIIFPPILIGMFIGLYKSYRTMRQYGYRYMFRQLRD